MSLSQQPGCLGVFGKFLKVRLGDEDSNSAAPAGEALPGAVV